MSEESGLTEATDLDSVVLDIQQIPVAAWIFPLVGLIFGGFLVGMLVPSLMVLWVFLFLASLVALIAGSVFTRTMRIEISPTTLTFQGWIGALPRPDTVSFPPLGPP